MRAFSILVVASFVALVLPAATADREATFDRSYDERGRIVAEVGVDADDTRIGYARAYHYVAEAADAAGLAAGEWAVTDCASTKYRLGGWRWSGPVDFATTAYGPQISAALATWDSATSANLVGSLTVGSFGTAGTYDGVNQIDWVPLGSGGTIAVTTTWYYRGSGQAVESDARYNTYYAWSTSGEAGRMDVQNIAAHELGHSFGLDHPKGKGVGCLTMYAYGSYGETAKRTLGDGDILGIRAIYG